MEKYISNDTIAAVATAPGTGGIGIVRISGPEAERVLSRVFRARGNGPDVFESHRLYYGKALEGEETLDECMAVLMRAPKSYTREDVAEIHAHGGQLTVGKILGRCLAEGARLAEPGEFTRRAFLNGRIDLSQAEAVMELISARGEQERKAAVRQLEGGASSFIRELSEELYGLQAGLAASIDYPEEISEEEGAGSLKNGLEKLIRRLEEALDEHASRLIHQGLQVALCGRPNVGKSSILNALLGEDRAIVTDIPGTTRDTVQGEIMIQGIRVQLTDTAGIRSTEDPVEKIGVERSEKVLRDADAAILILDGSVPLDHTDRELLLRLRPDSLIVINKTDLPPLVSEEMIHGLRPEGKVVTVSALQPASLQPIREYLKQLVPLSDRLTLTQPRHLEAARRAVGHLKDALRTLESFSSDVAATDLQSAQAALGEITGDRVDEKLLDHVFSRFCVGK